jgi:desulfoferrodoxin (superoxide reductase-like protein)
MRIQEEERWVMRKRKQKEEKEEREMTKERKRVDDGKKKSIPVYKRKSNNQITTFNVLVGTEHPTP